MGENNSVLDRPILEKVSDEELEQAIKVEFSDIKGEKILKIMKDMRDKIRLFLLVDKNATNLYREIFNLVTGMNASEKKEWVTDIKVIDSGKFEAPLSCEEFPYISVIGFVVVSHVLGIKEENGISPARAINSILLLYNLDSNDERAIGLEGLAEIKFLLASSTTYAKNAINKAQASLLELAMTTAGKKIGISHGAMMIHDKEADFVSGASCEAISSFFNCLKHLEFTAPTSYDLYNPFYTQDRHLPRFVLELNNEKLSIHDQLKNKIDVVVQYLANIRGKRIAVLSGGRGG